MSARAGAGEKCSHRGFPSVGRLAGTIAGHGSNRPRRFTARSNHPRQTPSWEEDLQGICRESAIRRSGRGKHTNRNGYTCHEAAVEPVYGQFFPRVTRTGVRDVAGEPAGLLVRHRSRQP
ncbi:hypothetical protein SLA_7447 [Streptomyces laurentii]|uniref:Uncharacterized protein n=1 Tax=Streptomyces laurentii TaxID=39478 RepID=A0A169PQV9_STRLU|nr:hypothetical protein SLA_7447 [Streptomyces laurentii]